MATKKVLTDLDLNGNTITNAPGIGWVVLTQAAYDALGTPDPDTLYIIVG